MKNVPILFSTTMVQAILNGSKTMTRRVVKNFAATYECPYGQIGDVLWVRETHQYTDASLNFQPGYVYKATDPDWETMEGWKWNPSIHMPKAACRLWLKVTNVRVERLQDISEEDAIAEGIERINPEGLLAFKSYAVDYPATVFPYVSFQTLWHKINGRESWEANPWVWVIEFEPCEMPKNFLNS